MITTPSLSLHRSSEQLLWGTVRGESCLFIHALADSWLQLAEEDGTGGGGGMWGRMEGNQGGETLNQSS